MSNNNPSFDKKSPKNGWISPHHRLVIYNDSAFKEEASLALNWRNVGLAAFGLLGLWALSVLVAVKLFGGGGGGHSSLAVTGGDNLREQLIFINGQLDSLGRELDARDAYIAQINQRIKGEFEYEKDVQEPSKKSADEEIKIPDKNEATKKIMQTAAAEAELVAAGLASADFIQAASSSSYSFDSPLSGRLLDSFSQASGSFGVKIQPAASGEVRATQVGTVVLAGWSAEAGHFLLLQHPNNLLSIYKQNSKLLKQQGDKVAANEVIALINPEGRKNPALHFELWHYGYPLNPQKLMAFF